MIGGLKDRVEILKPARAPDGGGGFAIDYAPMAEVHARLESRRARKERLADQVFFRRRETFTIRSRTDLVFEMRLRHGGRTFRITSIDDRDPQGRLTVIEAEEINP